MKNNAFSETKSCIQDHGENKLTNNISCLIGGVVAEQNGPLLTK